MYRQRDRHNTVRGLEESDAKHREPQHLMACLTQKNHSHHLVTSLLPFHIPADIVQGATQVKGTQVCVRLTRCVCPC